MCGIKNYKFTKGLIFNDESQVFIFLLNPVLLTLKKLSDDNSSLEFRKLLRSYSKIDSYILFKKYENFSKNKKLIVDEFITFINSLGFGFLELIKYTDSNMVFIQKNMFLTSTYFKLFGKYPSCDLEEMSAGFLEHFLSLLYGKKVNVELSKKNNLLIFNCSVSNDVFSYNTDKVYNFEKYDVENTTAWILKLILQKKIVCKNGVLGILGKYSITLPVYFYFTMISKYTDSQVDHSTDVVSSFVLNFVNLFDLTEPDSCKKIYEIMFPNWELIGLGQIGLDESSLDLSNFKYTSNIYSDYKKFYDYNFFEYFNTLSFLSLKGFYEFSYDKTTKLNFKNEFSDVKLDIVDNKRSNSKIVKELDKYLNKNSDIIKL